MPEPFAIIATVASPYRQKFAVPRQPNLVPEAEGVIEFIPPYDDPNMLRGLEQFSHLWLLFQFHEVADKGWSATVQPPRLGGKERVGVFASRSPFRPNAIGMSVVRNLGYEIVKGKPVLRVGGIDLVDGTPLLDIKPYIPYADALPQAEAGFAQAAPGHSQAITFSELASQQLAALETTRPGLGPLIRSVLSQDPRPAWRVKEADSKQYGMSLQDVNIKWQWQEDGIVVLRIDPEQAATSD